MRFAIRFTRNLAARVARPERRRVRHTHQFAGQSGVRLNQARQLRRIGGLLSGELGQLRANARHGRNVLRPCQGLAQEGMRR